MFHFLENVNLEYLVGLLCKVLLSFCILLFITSCKYHVTELKPGAEKILITEGVPSNCKLLDRIFAEGYGGATHKYLDQSQMNELKNKALEVKANVILLKMDLTLYMQNNSASIASHELEGEAYYCEPEDIKLIVKKI